MHQAPASAEAPNVSERTCHPARCYPGRAQQQPPLVAGRVFSGRRSKRITYLDPRPNRQPLGLFYHLHQPCFTSRVPNSHTPAVVSFLL